MPRTWLSIGLRSGLLAGHMSGLMNCGVSLRRSSTVSRARCAGALSCWKTNMSPAMLRIAGSNFCVSKHVSVTLPVDYCSRLNEDEVGTAEFGYCNSTCIEYQSAIWTSCGSVLLRHELNFNTVWWNASLPSVRRIFFCILQGSAVTFFRCGG